MTDKPVAAGKSSIDLINVDKAFEVFNLQPGTTVLDLACGVGRYSLEMARRYGDNVNIHAIDLWREGIEHLRSSIEAEGITSISPQHCDIREEIALGDQSIDSCLLATILHDLPPEEQKRVIRQIMRLLKPGGHINIVEFKKIDFGPGPPIKIRLDEQDLDALLTPLGFSKTTSIESGEYTYLVQYRFQP